MCQRGRGAPQVAESCGAAEGEACALEAGLCTGGQRTLHLSLDGEEQQMPNGSIGVQTKRQALLAEGCMSACLVLKTVSVVTEQTGSDKGSSRGEPGRLLGGAYVGWGEAAWLQVTLVRVHGFRDPWIPSSAGGTSCFLAPGNKNN